MSLQQLSIANVLCPTDFSESSGNALERASTIADWFHAKLTLLHVIPYLPDLQGGRSKPHEPGTGQHPVLAQSRTEVEQELRRAISLRARPGADIAWEIAEGEHWRRIEERAASLPADLVVMGNEGRTGWERLLVGSTTEKVMRRLRSPVLAVRSGGAAPHGPLFRRIVCALDLTTGSRDTIDLAYALAEENLAEVILLHVLDGSSLWDRLPPPPGSAEARADAARAMAKAELRALGERSWTFCRSDVVVSMGTPWREAIRVADDFKADVIVAGAHGPAAPGASFLGSTVDQIIRHAACPVLLAKPRNKTKSS